MRTLQATTGSSRTDTGTRPEEGTGAVNDFRPALGKTTMSEECFERFSRFIQGNFGIKMPPVKKTMLESRLQKRLRILGLESFEEYGEYLFSPEGLSRELAHMIDNVTTNKTDFFREPSHFAYLVDHALPELIRSTGAGVRKPLKIWSAGCSSGEEPYTLAMVLSEFSGCERPIDFTILGTDISAQVLDRALKGIYRQQLAEPIPEPMKKKYLMRSRDRESATVRIVPELRQKVRFQRVNLMDDDPQFPDDMDIIFCRNVIIYFERSVQDNLIRKLCRKMASGGYLFLGHSETLHGMNLPLINVGPMVYRRAAT